MIPAKEYYKTCYFDIETGPVDEDELLAIEPVHEPPKNFRDPDKIRDAIAEKSRAWRDKAALSPLTGQVLAIGWRIDGKSEFLVGMDEMAILQRWWEVYSDHRPAYWVGHNIIGFDVPYLIRRSWKYGLSLPIEVMASRGPSPEIWVDTMNIWSCGAYGPEGRVSLDNLAQFLGVGRKNGSGANFAQLLRGNKDEALDYLNNDLVLTEKVYEKIRRNP